MTSSVSLSDLRSGFLRIVQLLAIPNFCIVVAGLGAADLSGQEGIRLSRVTIQGESGTGLMSDVIRIPNNQIGVVRLGRTDSLGVLELPSPVVCQPGDRIQGVPADYEYYLTGKEDVRPVMVLTASLREKGAAYGGRSVLHRGLIAQAATADDPAERMLLFSRIADALEDLPAWANEAELRTLLAAGELLSVRRPVDYREEDGRFAASEELESAVRLLQLELGVESTGQLDGPTLEALQSRGWE